MKLKSKKMTEEKASKILSWKYEQPYDLYNNDFNEESMKELMESNYWAIEDKAGALIGFYCSGMSAQVPAGNRIGAYSEQAIDVGIGMNPRLTGKGHGRLFFSFVLHELGKINPNPIFRLSVALFNKRAIRLYSNMGFQQVSEFKTDAGIDFITMVKR
ncbi:GNAT family N-acetyltransferase [Mesobacillus subterraneus]|uniref:N-acetyltransferase n=1 Tax=Mesobacillus subterraneus TaxID=285983 RepID=A0A3R9DR98_9BACI|nr:GNAT family protein [Mesobacillus subterraneus]RSD25458.1 N-acetyltransferase [Mesobacillus subterraneus]